MGNRYLRRLLYLAAIAQVSARRRGEAGEDLLWKIIGRKKSKHAANVLSDLLIQIPEGEEIGSFKAYGTCDTRKCHNAIADRSAHAVVPPRKNGKPWKAIRAGARRDGDALREPKVRAAKLLAQRLMARDFDLQVFELQVRIAVLNGCAALGIPVPEAVG